MVTVKTVDTGVTHMGKGKKGKEAALAEFAKQFEGDPEYDIGAFFDQQGMTGVEERALVQLRKEWLERIDYWLTNKDLDDWYASRLTDEANRLRRKLGIPRPRNLTTIREQTRERVARFRERKKEQEREQKAVRDRGQKRRQDARPQTTMAAVQRDPPAAVMPRIRPATPEDYGRAHVIGAQAPR